VSGVRGRIIVSHVRLASSGGVRRENTHPWLYRGWAFAHNGTIHNKQKLLGLLNKEYRDLEGSTDSEMFFHLIVQEAEALRDPLKGISSAVKKIVESSRFSSLNFIASDGRRLYGLRYAARDLDYYSLYYMERPKEGLELKKLSRETQQLILTKLSRGERAVLIASEPMSDEPFWKEVPNEHLVVVDEGLNVKVLPLKA